MLYGSRVMLVSQLLVEAVEEGQDLMLFGSGVWFDALDRALARELVQHISKISVSQLNPLVRVSFKAGGSIQAIDLASGEGLHMVQKGEYRVPSKAYLVEDAHGVHAKVWAEHVRPFLLTGECKVIYLGNAQDAESN